MAVVDFAKAIFGLTVDDAEFDSGLKRAEDRVEDATRVIAGKFNALGVGIATAISLVAVAALGKVIQSTAAWGTEIETLAARMGQTTTKTSEMVGIMERFGVQSQVAAMSMGMLNMQIKATAEAADPFQTRLGRLFGTLRNANGELLTTTEVFDLARQKIAATTSEMEKLQIAQTLGGTRMGGRMLEILKLSNEEWEKHRKSIHDTGIVVDKETAAMAQKYQNMTAEINQSLRGIQMQLGAEILPLLIDILRPIADVIQGFTKFAQTHPQLTKLAAVLLLFGAPLGIIYMGMAKIIPMLGMMGVHLGTLGTILNKVKTIMDETAAAEAKLAAATEVDTATTKRNTAAKLENAGARTVVKTAAAGEAAGAGAAGAGGMMGKMGKVASVMAAASALFLAWQIGSAIGKIFEDQITTYILKVRSLLPQWLGGISEEAAQLAMQDIENAARGSDIEKKRLESVEERAKVEERIEKTTAAAARNLKATEQAYRLGIVSAEAQDKAAAEQLKALQKQEEAYRLKLADPSLKEGSEQRMTVEAELLETQTQRVMFVSDLAMKKYKDEELALRAQGAFQIENELRLLDKKLEDESIIGEDRKRIEAEVFQKREQYVEEFIKISRQAGVISVDQEMAYRRERASELFAKGNVTGAAQELLKVRDMAMQQADQILDFQKKLRIVSIQEEIDFQRSKLEIIKGNAEEEMKILGNIANLDKQQYDQRIQYSLNYTKSVQDMYNKVMSAAKGAGDVQTFEHARFESERQLREATREAGGVLKGGGTEAQRTAATEFSQMVLEQANKVLAAGDALTSAQKDALKIARDIMEAATGQRVRVPGDASPVVGSITSTIEGLATSNLARGSEIPRLDTSFTDIAVRIRDVLLGAIPNVQSFSNALSDATKQIAGRTGPGILAGAEQIQFGKPLATGAGTPAQPAFGGGGPSTVIKPEDFESALDRALQRFEQRFGAMTSQQADAIRETAIRQNETLQQAIASFKEQGGGTIKLEFDENTGQFLGQFVKKTVEEELRPF